jgi:hypothetical protein
MNRVLTWTTLLIAALSIATTACGSGSGSPDGGAESRPSLSLFGRTAAAPTTETARVGAPAAVATEGSGALTSPVTRQSTGGPGADADPCRLVTAEEAKAALGGRQPKAPKRTDFLGDPQCFYEEPEDGDVIGVVIDATNRGREAKESHDFIGKTLGYEPVRGVGDAAFIQPGLNVIDVVAGDTRFKIQIASHALPEAELRAKLIELGKGAVARLR